MSGPVGRRGGRSGTRRPTEPAPPPTPAEQVLAQSGLVRAALLGTGRAAPPLLPADSDLGRLAARLDDRPAPAHLLCLAGLVAQHAQVGARPAHSDRLPALRQAPPHDRPAPSTDAAVYLAAILDGQFRLLLPEFLGRLANTGRRVPDALLPNLLAHGAQAAVVRLAVPAALDGRQRWLAAQRPAWFYAATADVSWEALERQWAGASLAQRQAWLGQIRGHDPSLGRALLLSTWRADKVTDRYRLLRQLEINLSLDDEPFLETVLDDRQATIRRLAADLLARLPESRLGRRMIGHTRDVLGWRPDRDQRLAVTFPAAITPAMIRDGVTPAPGSTSRRSLQLQQLVGAVSLVHWTSGWRVSPAEIVTQIPGSGWPRSLTNAFVSAATRQQNSIWAGALLDGLGLSRQTLRLVDLLPPGDYHRTLARLAAAVAGQPLSREDDLVRLLYHRSGPWTEAMLDPWLARLRETLTPAPVDPPDSIFRTLLQRSAAGCPPARLASYRQALALLSPDAGRWTTLLHEITGMLWFRQGMLEALAVAPGPASQEAIHGRHPAPAR